MVKQEIRRHSPIADFVYSYVFIRLFQLLYFVFSLFDKKARRGLRGRRALFSSLERDLSGTPEGMRVWFHASSFGEFEQAKPIIEILKKSGFTIIASFFSPSGYEYSRNYPDADVVTYIPIDSRRNARRFVRLIKPSVAVVMRYDLWFNHISEAKSYGTKIILADATFPVKLFHRTGFLRDFYRRLYSLPHLILATTAEHKKMFDFFLGTESTEVAGDTRFDRVYSKSVSNTVRQKLPVELEKDGRTVLVLGSTWPQDMEVLVPGLKRIMARFPSVAVIVVPHEPTVDEVKRLAREFPESMTLSEMERGSGERPPVLIIDRIGLLTQLYVVADMAYVGGGFGAGVHSVLEPAVYGIPILTGPRIERSDEAIQLMQNGALFYVKDAAGAYRSMLRMMEDDAARNKAGQVAREFVDRHLGAAQVVATKVIEFSGTK